MDNILTLKNKEIELLIDHCHKHNDEFIKVLNELDDVLDENLILYDYIDFYRLKNKQLQQIIKEKDDIINDYVQLIERVKNFISSIQESNLYIQLFNPSKIVENLMILFHHHVCGSIYDSPSLTPTNLHNRS